MVILKTREFKIKEIDLKEREKAMRVMDEIRKRYKIKKGEKSSPEIIRYFRDTRSR